MKIEKDVPLPDAGIGGNGLGGVKYPFREMNVGDSVFFEGDASLKHCLPYSAARMMNHRTGMKFSGRIVDGGVRIWRVS